MAISDHLKRDVERHSKKSAERKAAVPSKKVHRFEVTPASDGSGYHVETSYRNQEAMGKGGAIYSEYSSPSARTTSVHKSISGVAKHMKDCCGESGKNVTDGDQE